MNPSTEDLLNACNQVNAESVIIFPNNSNIIMAAQQVVELCDKKVVVVPTKSIMQAITALITYDPEGESEEIAAAMIEEMQQVKYAEVTHAVRDSSINGLTIKDGDIIGILGGEIKVTSSSPEDALLKLLELMVDDDSSLITYFFGDEINEDEASKVYNTIVERYSDCDVEYHFGGQPHYSYVISVE